MKTINPPCPLMEPSMWLYKKLDPMLVFVIHFATLRKAGFSLELDEFCTMRKQVQKVEFFVCWLVIFATLGTDMGLDLPIMWLKLTAFTRSLAYAVDFAKAFTKFNGSIIVVIGILLLVRDTLSTPKNVSWVTKKVRDAPFARGDVLLPSGISPYLPH